MYMMIIKLTKTIVTLLIFPTILRLNLEIVHCQFDLDNPYKQCIVLSVEVVLILHLIINN